MSSDLRWLKAELRMKDLVKSTNILIMASHSKEQILNTCNRVIWLVHGKIKMDADEKTVTAPYFGQ